MAKHPIEAPVRLGVWEPKEGAAARRVGWSALPAGNDLRLRMSGLLWPEAGGRLANSAALTRELRRFYRLGQQQKIRHIDMV